MGNCGANNSMYIKRFIFIFYLIKILFVQSLHEYFVTCGTCRLADYRLKGRGALDSFTKNDKIYAFD